MRFTSPATGRCSAYAPTSRQRLEVETGRHPARQVSRRLLGALDRVLPGVAESLSAVRDAPSAGRAAPARYYARRSDEARSVADVAEARGVIADVGPDFPEVD